MVNQSPDSAGKVSAFYVDISPEILSCSFPAALTASILTNSTA